MDDVTETILMARIRELLRPLAPVPTDLVSGTRVLPDIRAILFDIYGTLLVSASGDIGTTTQEGMSRAMVEAFEAAGFGVLTEASGARLSQAYREAVQTLHAGERMRGVDYPEIDVVETWRGLLVAQGVATGLDTEEANRRLLRFCVELECRVNPVWLMPDAVRVLRMLRDRGVMVGVISNAQYYTPLTLKALMGPYAELLLGREDLAFWSYRERMAKPSARLFGRAAEHLERCDGVTPSQVLYVGNDMRNDIAPAARMGMRTALFAGDQRSLRLRPGDSLCAGIKPDVVLTRLQDLLSVIGPCIG